MRDILLLVVYIHSIVVIRNDRTNRSRPTDRHEVYWLVTSAKFVDEYQVVQSRFPGVRFCRIYTFRMEPKAQRLMNYASGVTPENPTLTQ